MPAIDPLFDELLAHGASDLHLAVGHPPLLRRQRALHPLGDQPVTLEQLEQLLFELLDDERRGAFEQTHDLDFAYCYGDRARFRANYFLEHHGPAAVFHHIPARRLDAAELGLPQVVLRLAERTSGLLLLTGNAGSGRTTTMAALVAHLNRNRAASIVTIEDPVEFVHLPQRSEITHREIGLDTPSFAAALRAARRESADVIVVGRLDDDEAMLLALELAAAGVLVLATLQASTVTASLERLLDAAPSLETVRLRGLLGEALVGVVGQQLVPRADGHGRVAAHEILVASPAIAIALREGRPAALVGLMHAGLREGMQTMDAALAQLAASGVITTSEALERAHDKQSFARAPSSPSHLARPGDPP